jgi:nucleoside-diphosphate-sugar epimerase
MAGFTVIGGAGFVGSALVSHLEAQGHACHATDRRERLEGEYLEHVIYCAGLTGDWSERPYDTVDAHVSTLAGVARACTFESLLYLSSTRVYDRHPGPLAKEEDHLVTAPEDLYSLSKAMGEAVALAAGGRVARLSNVYGPRMEGHAFLAALLREAAERGRVTLESSLDSSRDFVSVGDVAALLARTALDGTERVYNVASGIAVTNRELSAALTQLTGCEVLVRPGAERVVRPPIDIARVSGEFGFEPARLLDDLPGLLAAVPS